MPSDNGFLQHILTVYERARQARAPHEAVWDRCLRAYRGEYDFSGRQKWQSRCVLPKIARDVDFVAQSIGAAVGDDQQETFALKGGSEIGELAAPILAEMVQANLEREGFADQMRGMLTYGQLTPGVVAKVTEIPGPWSGYVRVSPVPYRRYFADPSGRRGCLLCVTPMDRSEARRMCEANGWDASALDRLSLSGDHEAAEDERKWLKGAATAIGWQADADDLRRTVFLLEYWGPAYDADGNETSEWAYGVVANKSVLLHGPEDAPFGSTYGRPRRMADVVAGDLLSDPFALYAKPYAADALGVAEMQQEVVNLLLDQAKLQVNAIGVNYDAIEAAGGDGAQALRTIMTEGVAAGKSIPFRGAQPPLVPLQLAHFNGELLNVLALLDQERQAATGATDMVRGLAATEDTSSQTLGEYQAKQAASGRSLAALGKGLEKRFIEPLIETILWHYRNAGFSILPQPEYPAVEVDVYGNPTPAGMAAMQEAEARADERLAAIRNVCGRQIESAVSEMVNRGLATTQDEALEKLDAAMRDEYQVHAAGVSAVLERAEAQKKLEALLTQVAQLGAMSAVDRARTLRTMARLANLDLNDVLKDNFDALLMSQEQAMAALPPPVVEGGGPNMPPEGM